MFKKDIRKLITTNKAIKEMQKNIRGCDEEEYEIFVRCFIGESIDEINTTTLMIEIHFNDRDYDNWVSTCIAEIDFPETDNIDEFWKNAEKSFKIFEAMKNNIVRDIERIGYKVYDTKDYTL